MYDREIIFIIHFFDAHGHPEEDCSSLLDLPVLQKADWLSKLENV